MRSWRKRMEESRVKQIERGIDMCEEIKRYLLENKEGNAT